MMLFDMRTIIFSNMLTDIVCLAVIILLWRQSRGRFAGMDLLVFDFALQTTALFLIILRGNIPNWISIVLANAFVIAGTLSGYMGLERFLNKKSTQIHNYILLIIFVLVHIFFAFFQPNQAVRNLNIAIGIFVICFQCAWLLLYRVPTNMRRLTFGIGIIFSLYCVVSVIRIVEFFTGEHITTDYLRSGTFEQSVLISYQMLFILLTYGLTLMINKRLLVDIKTEEEKFSKAFYSSPYAITITRLSDGRIVEVNDSFFNITGYQPADIRGETTIGMHLWDRAEDRAFIVGELASKGKVQGREFQFRKKSGERITGLFSAEIITINNEKCVLSSINDISERKKAEEVLASSEQFLSNVIEQSPVSLWISDSEGTLIKMNQACRELFGVTDEEAVGKYNIFKDNLIEEQGFMPLVENVFEKGEIARFTIDYDLPRVEHIEVKEGTHRILDVVVSSIKDIHGKLTNALVHHKDITELKQAESQREATLEALRENEQQLRLITDNVRDTLWLMDLGMRTTWISPSVVRTRGYTLVELAEMPMDRHLAPGSLARMMELSAVHLTPERLADPSVEIIVSEELEYYRKDGSTFWADTLVTLLRDKEGRPSGFLGVGRDISERKKAEDALKESERQYRNLFENSMEGIFQTTPEGRLISVNMAFASMFGYESPEEVVRAVTDIGSQLYANPEERKKAVNILKETGYLKDFECQMRRKDDTPFWTLINARFTESPDGPRYFEGFIIDITGRKLAESQREAALEEIHRLNTELEKKVAERTKELQESQLALLNLVDDLNQSAKNIALTNQALEVTNKELEAFSYSVSHDLRAPLRSIDGFSRALLEDYQKILDDKGRNYLDKVCKAAQQMGNLIDDMLKLSRVIQSEFRQERVELTNMVKKIAQTCKKSTPRRTVKMVIQEGIIVQGDPDSLQIALTNLIENAWKFTGKQKHPRIEFGATLKKGENVFFVRDNGVGFDMAYVDKLFGAFQRLHAKDEFAGTGIGLATVQRIIHRHGGKIWAEGKVGKGATFFFTLPA